MVHCESTFFCKDEASHQGLVILTSGSIAIRYLCPFHVEYVREGQRRLKPH